MRSLLSICAAILVFLCLCGFVNRQNIKKPQPPLIEVGTRTVSLQQFQREMSLAYPDISGLARQEQLSLKKQLIKQLIDRELILGEAARLDVRISPDELDTALREVRGSYSAEDFEKLLSREGKSLEGWLAALKLRLVTAKVNSAVLAPQIEVADADIEKYYREHREDFRRPLEIKARQMLFTTCEDAEKVLSLLKEGGDFAELAKRYSLSPDRENGGALGYFSKGILPAEFDGVLFNLPVRQVSEPVKSPYGYHLFLVERKRPAGLRPYAAVKDEIAALLYRQQEEQVFKNWMDNLHSSQKINVHWELIQPEEQDKK